MFAGETTWISNRVRRGDFNVAGYLHELTLSPPGSAIFLPQNTNRISLTTDKFGCASNLIQAGTKSGPVNLEVAFINSRFGYRQHLESRSLGVYSKKHLYFSLSLLSLLALMIYVFPFLASWRRGRAVMIVFYPWFILGPDPPEKRNWRWGGVVLSLTVVSAFYLSIKDGSMLIFLLGSAFAIFLSRLSSLRWPGESIALLLLFQAAFLFILKEYKPVLPLLITEIDKPWLVFVFIGWIFLAPNLPLIGTALILLYIDGFRNGTLFAGCLISLVAAYVIPLSLYRRMKRLASLRSEGQP